MKLLFYSLLMYAMIVSAHAQTGAAAGEAGNSESSMHDSAPLATSQTGNRESIVTELLLTYVANVDRLLRDLAEKMRSISEQVEAGELTPLQAQALKLDTTRSTIGRLETLSAVYDSVIFNGNEDNDTRLLPGDASPTVLIRTKPTVSVKELAAQGAQ